MADQNGGGRLEHLLALALVAGLGVVVLVALYGAATGPVRPFVWFSPFNL